MSAKEQTTDPGIFPSAAVVLLGSCSDPISIERSKLTVLPWRQVTLMVVKYW